MGLALLAFLAGVISILTPCCLPLIPGYVSFIAGVGSGESSKRLVIGASLLFILGFAAVFTALGATASILGSFLLKELPIFLRVAGAFVIIMGMSMVGLFRLPFLYREARFDMSKMRSGPVGAFPLGMAFAFGWTPCIGPVLGGIFSVAATTTTAWKGAALLFVYSLGMGIPFLAIAYAYARSGKTGSFLKSHSLGIERAGGALLIVMGILLVSGDWQRLFNPIVRFFVSHNWPPV
ncbi:MAG: cytochrome c biogenesis CcdA family protein [Actinomycetota bacterium]|nr:cytochrome c biogenesis CcdA family protein [Actinomycetota bacterium]